jgi:cell division protein FtsW (lipid II flippase)
MFSRSLSFPILAVLVVLLTATACVQVWQVGAEWFVQRPPLAIVIRNVAMVVALLVGGWLLIPRPNRTSKAATLLAVAASLFGVGLATQFRLGHDYPRQLSRGEVAAIADSVQGKLRGGTQDSVRKATRRIAAERNAELRRDFEASRIDLRLARSLERAYGPTPLTRQVLGGRAVGPSDNLLLRLIPVMAGLLALLFAARSTVPALLSSHWKLVGFYGSFAVCVATFIYLTVSGGIRGATFAPQELLKLTLPVAWAGFLLHFRNALRPERREVFAKSPLALWIYIIGLLTLPLGVFLVMRDFGQFLVIGLAQVLLLAWFTRSTLYVVLFTGGFLATGITLLSGKTFSAASLLLLLGVVVGAVLAIGAVERYRRRDSLWTSASLALVGYTAIATLAVQLPFIARMIATPRQRFLLWADLYSRHGDPAWWDRSRQIIEALYAFDAGGIAGRGLGEGTPFLIPKAASDFVFAAITEELGIVGGLLILLSFLSLVAIGLRLARQQGEATFGGLVIAGATLLLGVQAVVHIAGTMNLLPMTGITLPLVSSGVSSAAVSWALVGIILGIGSQSTEANTVVIRKDLQRPTLRP